MSALPPLPPLDYASAPPPGPVTWLLILAFIWFFVFRQLRKNAAARTPMPVIIVNPEAR